MLKIETPFGRFTECGKDNAGSPAFFIRKEPEGYQQRRRDLFNGQVGRTGNDLVVGDDLEPVR